MCAQNLVALRAYLLHQLPRLQIPDAKRIILAAGDNPNAAGGGKIGVGAIELIQMPAIGPHALGLLVVP